MFDDSSSQIFKLSERNLPQMEAVLTHLIEISEDLVKHPPNGVYSTMILAALLRGIEHARSLLKLKLSIDSWLVARSMLEGSAIVLWVREDIAMREERALRWSDAAHYEANIIWGSADKHIRKQESPEREYSKARVRRSNITDDKLKDRAIAGDLEDFSFVKYVTGQTIKQLIKGMPAGGPELYAFHYRMFTGFHHWNPFLFNADDRSGLVVQRTRGYDDYWLAVTLGYVCLEIFATTVDAYYGATRLADIDSLEALYHAAIENGPSVR